MGFFRDWISSIVNGSGKRPNPAFRGVHDGRFVERLCARPTSIKEWMDTDLSALRKNDRTTVAFASLFDRPRVAGKSSAVASGLALGSAAFASGGGVDMDDDLFSMRVDNAFSSASDSDSSGLSLSGSGTEMHEGICINPATGLPMILDSCAGVDVGGNPYGMDLNDSLSNVGSCDLLNTGSLEIGCSASFDSGSSFDSFGCGSSFDSGSSFDTFGCGSSWDN